MPKGERRRRRRFEQSGAESVPENLDTSAAEGEETAGAPGTAEGGEPSQSRGMDPDSEPAKPIALAEILANPSYAESLRAQTQTTSAIPRRTIEPSEPLPEPVSVPIDEETVMADQHGENSDYGSPAYSPVAASAAPAWARSTRDPAVIALLLVALVVLAVDTYFTIRLNGLSDRLAAVAAKAAAPIVTAADRPWVGVDTIETAQFANGGQPITTVHIVNSGRQPAYDLRSNTVGSLRSATTPAPDIPAQKGPLATTGLLLPNTGGKLTFFANTRALTPQEASNVKNGQYVLWLAGRLDYKDAASRAHLTSFRYRYNPALNSFIASPQGNSAN